MKHHLCIFPSGWIELILTRQKYIESRFTKVRCAPFGKVSEGDIVYMKERGGAVKGMFTVAKVETYENLTARQRDDIFEKYHHKIFAGAQWINTVPERWWDAEHATLIHIRTPIAFENPRPFPKRDPRAWVVLDKPLHVCMECDTPFLLEVKESPDGELFIVSEHFCAPCYARTCVSPSEEIALSESEYPSMGEPID